MLIHKMKTWFTNVHFSHSIAWKSLETFGMDGSLYCVYFYQELSVFQNFVLMQYIPFHLFLPLIFIILMSVISSLSEIWSIQTIYRSPYRNINTTSC